MGTADRSRARFAYWLIAPAVAFMVLIHLIPTAAGMFLSLLNLNTFTFQRLFGAPWAGLENYNSILFDSANPLHSGFTNAASNTAFYTAWTVGLTLVLGLAIALLLNRPAGRRCCIERPARDRRQLPRRPSARRCR